MALIVSCKHHPESRWEFPTTRKSPGLKFIGEKEADKCNCPLVDFTVIESGTNKWDD